MSSTEYSCPHCSHGPFTGSRGLKVHYRAYHSRRRTDGKYSKEVMDLLSDVEKSGVEQTFSCECCGDEFTRRVYSDADPTYCSHKCAAEAGLPDNSGENHPQWQGGKSYGYLRRKAFERASYQCERCSKPVDESTGEAHHLIPRSAGGPDALANLAVVCESCHSTIHETVFGEMAENHPELLDRFRDVVCTNTQPEIKAND